MTDYAEDWVKGARVYSQSEWEVLVSELERLEAERDETKESRDALRDELSAWKETNRVICGERAALEDDRDKWIEAAAANGAAQDAAESRVAALEEALRDIARTAQAPAVTIARAALAGGEDA